MNRGFTSKRNLTVSQKIRRVISRTVLLWPALVLLAIFFLWPMLMSVYYSFTNLALSGAAAKASKRD